MWLDHYCLDVTKIIKNYFSVQPSTLIMPPKKTPKTPAAAAAAIAKLAAQQNTAKPPTVASPPPAASPMSPPTENGAAQVDGDEPEQVEEKGIRGQASKDMQNVTGYVNEEAAGKDVDEAKLGKAMSFLQDAAKKQKEEQLAKINEVEKVVVSKEDVELIMSEMQVTKPVAERHLRENKGDVLETLRKMVVV
ncbi:hypothetical protein BC938DRAFT_483856 [Jimgerdemannia flammicorona]|uniref:Nascent polypeptide-associated complex subunit alpha-like UBA domain-containing protein n=1 Tax=Jimgerdemannia flammicorona TaxID=994334 RepID=A0A433QB07_9FUNG|nr:hypothetical protein BC938DRAFT_483856 [Jimgerdemannia flammicorona]